MEISCYTTTMSIDIHRSIAGFDISHYAQSHRAPYTLRRQIGGTTYILSGRCSPHARETAVEKIQRLILADPHLTI